jgi:hypothetical protein
MVEPEQRDLRLYVVINRKEFIDIQNEKAILIFSLNTLVIISTSVLLFLVIFDCKI